MFISDVVAVVIALSVMNQGLEVEIWQLEHDLVHDVFKEVIVEGWYPCEHLQVGTVLRQASVQNSIVLIVGINDRVLQPLIISISHEALATLKLGWTVHLAMTTEVRPEGRILPDGVLHERAAIIHV